jgi:hypothetical protein
LKLWLSQVVLGAYKPPLEMIIINMVLYWAWTDYGHPPHIFKCGQRSGECESKTQNWNSLFSLNFYFLWCVICSWYHEKKMENQNFLKSG